MRQHKLDSPASYYAIYYAVRILPNRVCRFLGRLTASIVYGFSKRDRAGLSANISLALDRPASDPFVRRTVRQVFLNYGDYLIDFFLFPQLSLRKIRSYFSSIHGEEILKEALARERGAILLSAHIGHWEIGGYILRLLDYPLAVVTMAHNTDATNDLVDRARYHNNIQSIEVKQSPFTGIKILRHLRNNGIVAMHGDKDFFARGREVAFFGKSVRFPSGPVMLAMNSGAALIPTFVFRGRDGKYFGVLEQPIPLLVNGDRDAVLSKNLEMIARVFESYIRSYPDQWYSPDPIG